jgi:hypothetical protein
VAGVVMVVTTSGSLPGGLGSFWVSSRGVWVGMATMAALAVLQWRQARLLPVALMALVVVERSVIELPYFGYDHPRENDWTRFCRLVKAQTPADAVFVTPPHLGGFTMLAQRAEVANFKCTPSIEADLIEWKRRMDELAGRQLRCSGWPDCGQALAAGYGALREDDFLRLARKYQARFVVTSQQRLGFPELLRLGDFLLYSVPR